MEVWAAVVAGVFGLVGGGVGAWWTSRRERRRIDADFRIAEQRLQAELRTEFQAEAALRQLLLHDEWTLRTFETIEHHVGGFEGDELRRMLVRTGALRFRGRDGEEMWGLRERNEDRLID